MLCTCLITCLNRFYCAVLETRRHFRIFNNQSIFFSFDSRIRIVRFYPYLLSFLIWPFLPTHCKCRGVRLKLIKLNNTNTHTQTHTHTQQDSSGQMISPSQSPLPCDTQHSQATDPQSRQACIHRHKPSTARPPGSA